jgi:hypothetical protein
MGLLNWFKKNGNLGISLRIMGKFPVSNSETLIIPIHKILKPYFKDIFTEAFADTKTKKLLTELRFNCYNSYYKDNFQNNPRTPIMLRDLSLGLVELQKEFHFKTDLKFFRPENEDIEELLQQAKWEEDEKIIEQGRKRFKALCKK